MGNYEADKKFCWVIKNFSSLQSEKIYSDQFVIGGCRWRVLAFPKGNGISNYLSLYLEASKYESLPCGLRRHAKVIFTIVNHIPQNCSQVKETQHWFDEKVLDWGFTRMLPLNELKAKDSGFLVNDELNIVVEIEVLEVIGQLDVSERMDVKGFQVLPSQVRYVNHLFERHPNIATKFHIKNQYMKTWYMNILLSLAETVRRPPNEISKDDLADAYVALKSMTVAGFKLDWLENKLDQVSRKKKKVVARETRIQETTEELKDLNRKYSYLEAQLKMDKAELLDAMTPLSLSYDDFSDYF